MLTFSSHFSSRVITPFFNTIFLVITYFSIFQHSRNFLSNFIFVFIVENFVRKQAFLFYVLSILSFSLVILSFLTSNFVIILVKFRSLVFLGAFEWENQQKVFFLFYFVLKQIFLLHLSVATNFTIFDFKVILMFLNYFCML